MKQKIVHKSRKNSKAKCFIIVQYYNCRAAYQTAVDLLRHALSIPRISDKMDCSITAYSGFPSRPAVQHAATYMTVQVQHYGYEFMYGANTVNPQQRIGALPSWLDPILLRIVPFVPVRAAARPPRRAASGRVLSDRPPPAKQAGSGEYSRLPIEHRCRAAFTLLLPCSGAITPVAAAHRRSPRIIAAAHALCVGD
jgi:hypothetical protein